MYVRIRAQERMTLNSPGSIGCVGLPGFGNSMGKTARLYRICDKSQLFSFLGGAVMLLVYEYTYSWLQENW